MTVLLHGCERLIVTFGPCVSNLDLMNIWGSFLGESILCGFRSRQFVGLIWTFVSFKLISLFEAHFEIMLTLLGSLLNEVWLWVHRVLSWLLHAALILGQVIEFVASKRKVWFHATYTRENFISFLFSLLYCIDFVSIRFRLCKAILGRALGEVKVLGWQVRLAQLIGKFKALSFLVGVKMSSMVRKIFLILWKAIKVVFATQLPVAGSKVRLCNHRLRVPFLLVGFFFHDILYVQRFCVAKLKVRCFDLLCLL